MLVFFLSDIFVTFSAPPRSTWPPWTSLLYDRRLYHLRYLRRHPQVRPDILSVVAKGMCPGKKSVKSLVFYQTHSPFPEISMLNLFSFQDQKFGHKRRGAGHSGNNGHGGKEGGLLLSVPHLVSCKGHEVYGECWDGVKSLLKQCRTNLANMSTCTSPGDHTEYCSDIGKVASSICAMLWSFSQVFVLEPNFIL